MLEQLKEQRETIREFLEDKNNQINVVEYYENLELLPELNKQIAQLEGQQTGKFSNLY